MGSQNVIDYRKRRKENLVKVCGGKCCLCGYSKLTNALEFHHLIPENKSYGIGSSGACHNIQQDILEIRKCILVCANCHREIHSGLYELDFLKEKQYFDENLILELTTLKKDKEYFCLKCNQKITQYSSSGLCSTCKSKENRLCLRPSREELKILIRNKSFSQIGRDFGVSDNAIRKWCIALKLPHKKQEINNYTDSQWSEI